MLKFGVALWSLLLAVSLYLTGCSAQESISLSGSFSQSTCSSVALAERSSCGGGSLLIENERDCLNSAAGCCFNATGTPKCYTNTAFNPAATKTFADAAIARAAVERPSDEDQRALLGNAGNIARSLNLDGTITAAVEERAASRSSRNFLTLAITFPECAVDVPMCYRVQCNAGVAGSETNPLSCLSNPACCFDRNLLLYRFVFGIAFMGGAPVCYYGPTSPRYTELAQRFVAVGQYNPFFQPLIVNLFQAYFDSVLNFQGQAVCQLTGLLSAAIRSAPLCGWPGIKELECHLKGCCFNTDSCYYPVQSDYFRQPTFFPELSSSSNTQTCPNNIQFLQSFTPSIYRRLPCAQAESGLALFATCRLRGCCFDATALSPALLNFYAISSLGSGNTGIFGTFGVSGINPLLLPGLSGLGSVNAGNLATQFFCPFRAITLPGFPRWENSVRGCCEVQACFHAANRGTIVPTIPPIQTCQWSQWSTGSCSAPCGSTGQQQRQRSCFFSNNSPGCNSCPGSGSDFISCQGPICVGSWTIWSSGACNAACGTTGSRRDSRSCLYQGRPSNTCPGSPTRQVSCQRTNCGSWTPWSLGTCNAACGRQGSRRDTRTCLYQGAQSNSCPGSSNRQTSCTGPPCYGLGEWSNWSFCQRTCRRERRRYCFATGSSRASSASLCGRSAAARQEEPCTGGICLPRPNVPWVTWGGWMSWSSCSLGCGTGRRIRERLCLYQGRPDLPLDPSVCVCSVGANGVGASETENCNIFTCVSGGGIVVQPRCSYGDWVSDCDSCNPVAGTRRRNLDPSSSSGNCAPFETQRVDCARSVRNIWTAWGSCECSTSQTGTRRRFRCDIDCNVGGRCLSANIKRVAGPCSCPSG